MIARFLLPAAFIALGVVATASDAASPAVALDIHNDRGGYLFEYVIRFERAAKPIRILGTCASACTLALRYSSTCVGRGAVLRFHAVYGAGPHNARLTRWLMAQYPVAIQQWISSQGGLTGRLIDLRGEALRRRIRECRS